MASSGSPRDDYKSRNSDSKPRSNRKPPRYGIGFDTELSLNSELQKSEAGENHSLPNNLTWTGGAAYESQKGNKSKRAKESTQRGRSSEDPPTRFTRKKHTPATMPRTKFSSGDVGASQHRAMDKLKQQLSFGDDEEGDVGEEQRMNRSRIVELPANNERNVHQASSGVPTGLQGVHPLPIENGSSSSAAAHVPPIDSRKILQRLKQVREYLKQATSLFIALNSKSSSPDEATDEDLDQMDKLATLIKHLKTQEKAYVDFVQRSIAVHGESSIDNTPSTSVVSLDGENQDDLVSEESEGVEGLRQQHTLLRKMVEQQTQLKELQERQNALLDLQRVAENQLNEAETEGKRISGLLNGNVTTERRQISDAGSVSGRSRSGTERSDDSRSPQRGAVGGQVNWRRASGDDLPVRQLNRDEQGMRNRRLAGDRKPENFKNQRPTRNEAAPVYESTGSMTPDNEAQALAMADAAQERLELESKLMDLQAKKAQMDTLVDQLRELREMQLGKEMALPQQRSINETIENGEEDVPFTTKSAKDTGDNVDDEKILEALQLHRKLRKLQDVKDKLEKLKHLFGEEEDSSIQQSLAAARVGGADRAQEPADSASESAIESVAEDDDVTSNRVLPGSLEWILSSGIDDPELLAKLRQVKAAKERVANLKQRNEQSNVAQSTTSPNTGTRLVRHQPEDEDSGAVGETDGETGSCSISSSLMWQEDPEFQEKLRKLNAARKKLRRLQELVKKTEELPNGPNSEPYLPAELVDISSSTDDEDNESDEGVQPGNNGCALNGDNDSEDDVTSETLIEEAGETLGECPGENDLDTEIAYMDKLTKQRAALNDLLSEKHKLLETQEQFKRLRMSDAVTQTRTSAKCKQLDTYIHNPTEVSTSRPGPYVDSATQTFTAPNRRVEKQTERPDAFPSNSLLWLELRRQRELQEQKLKKRKETLMLAKKPRISAMENGSDGGGNSVEDEGIGRSTVSADVTTATWGGSTQMSSTQNDSAVSDEGSSNGTDEEILVHDEDDPSDGIVQAEEEEEANSELEMFPSDAGGRNQFQNIRRVKQNAREKQLLFEGLQKRDLERHERFKGWQNSLFSSGNKKQGRRPQDIIEGHEDERYNRERDMWERQFNLQQSQLENTTSLCNTLLRDQQTLVSLLLNRAENLQSSAFSSGPNTFSQYQQRQQEAYQGIQSYFEQQRFLVQQQQMLQNLTECYSQMQQQHEDMLHLQRSFAQLFSLPSSESDQNVGPSTDTNAVPLNGEKSQTTRPFNFRPETSVKETPPPSPFAKQATSAERQSNPLVNSQTDDFGHSSWSSGLRSRQFHFVGSTNPDTGVPSPQRNNTQGFNHASVPVKPVSARVVSDPKQSPGNPSLVYSSVAYTDSQPSTSNVVVGKQFPTPLRATAAALLAGQDKSSLRGVKRRKVDGIQEKIETDSISSHQSSLPGDSEKLGTESDVPSDYSLFEALRDSIYSEVATLISQNECRPHFLIELFRELQLLSSDYLRQRALYSLRDLLTRFLKDDPPGGTIETAMGSYPWVESASEQTPSESAGLSETDQDQDKEMEPKIPEVSTQGIYDYAEAVESGSNLSTPNSTCHQPFASEFLGETVIHLDKALRSMRERRDSENSSVAGVNDDRGAGVQGDEITSSGGDIASESSLPDIQYPKIDTQALDRQIKKIMAEVIPCLNDHMENTCSVDLLEYIRKMVMSMIQQKSEGREFSRFFHKQLESILQDSLAKFIGKRMKDCGEDLLVDISEILFNELAFFKLMQELDGGVSKAKFFNRQQKYQLPGPGAKDPLSEAKSEKMSDSAERKEENAEDDEVEIEVEMENENVEDQDAEGDDSSESSELQIIGEKQEEVQKSSEGPISREQLEQDEEALGRERDDAMAEEFDEARSRSEADATESAQCINIVELSVSESRPLASNGSGEEDESVIEIETARLNTVQNEENPEGDNWCSNMNGSHSSPGYIEQESQMAATGSKEGQGTSSNQDKQDDDQYDDDLPTKFTGLTEADLQVKIAEEQSRNDGIHGILSIDDREELAGDPSIAPEPEGAGLVNGDIDEPEK